MSVQIDLVNVTRSGFSGWNRVLRALHERKLILENGTEADWESTKHSSVSIWYICFFGLSRQQTMLLVIPALRGGNVLF